MRLGDLDDLKKALDEQMNFDENCRDSVFNVIDNAPTIIWCNETSDGLPLIDLRPRPQGEWIITKDEKFYHYKCQFCGFWATGDFLRTNGNLDLPNFCEKCGADLRGKKK